jgi:regulatory protein
MQILLLKKKGRYYFIKMSGIDSLYRIHPDTMFQFSLYEGKEFNEDEWSEFRIFNEYAFAWESALRMLSIRAHCERDMRNKLRKKKFSTLSIEKVLEECKRLQLVDDVNFARIYISELKEKGMGRQMIKVKLSGKGVGREIIEEELECSFSEDDELSAAESALKKKILSLKRESNPLKRKEKFCRYMASRGFGYDVINELVGRLDE